MTTMIAMFDADEMNTLLSVLTLFIGLCGMVGGIMMYLLRREFITREVFYDYVERQGKLGEEIRVSLNDIKNEIKLIALTIEDYKKKHEGLECGIESMKDDVAVLKYINGDKK
jgi:hypothetical protein